ncbi:RNA polymerase sigma factor [Acidobacteriota bacterium]
MNEQPDAELVRRARKGDDDAFEELIRRYQRDAYRLALRMTGRHEDADELAQEAFMRAYTGLKNFKGESSFKTWLYRITINLSINSRNKAKRERDRLQPLEEARVGTDPTNVKDILLKQMRHQVKRAIRHLPVRQRETLVLRLYDEMKFSEIASVMECSEGTAKANFFHAVSNLKKVISG